VPHVLRPDCDSYEPPLPAWAVASRRRAARTA